MDTGVGIRSGARAARENKIERALQLLMLPHGLDREANGDEVSGIRPALYEATRYADVDRYTGIIARMSRATGYNRGPSVVDTWVKAFYDLVLAPAGVEKRWVRMSRNYLMLLIDDDDADTLIAYVRAHKDALRIAVRPLRAAICDGRPAAHNASGWTRA